MALVFKLSHDFFSFSPDRFITFKWEQNSVVIFSHSASFWAVQTLFVDLFSTIDFTLGLESISVRISFSFGVKEGSLVLVAFGGSSTSSDDDISLNCWQLIEIICKTWKIESLAKKYLTRGSLSWHSHSQILASHSQILHSCE